MDVIETRIDKDSEEYKANYAAMEALVKDLKQELKKARDERPQKDIDRLAAQGKLPVRKKLDLLLDKNTPFLEIAPLAARGMYDGKIHGAGLVAGIGVVEGHEVLVVASDAMIKGGAVYPMGVKKNLRCQTICMENRLPMVNLLDSAGAYLPLQSEIFPDVDDGGRIFYNQAVISKMGIPQITAVMGLCTAGGAYVPAMSDEVVHVKGTGAIFLGGPPLVKAATGEEVTADELGGALVHCSESGVSDYFAEDDAHAVAILRKIVRGLPKNEKARLTMGQAKPPLYDPKEIYGIVSRDLKVPYDCREVIARIVDGERVSGVQGTLRTDPGLRIRHISTGIRWASWGTTASSSPTAPSRPPSSSSSATGGRSPWCSSRTSTATSSGRSTSGWGSRRTATRW